VPPDFNRPIAGRIARFSVELIVVAGVGVVWHWTASRDWISLESVVSVADSPLAVLVVLAVYVVAGLLVVPITVLVILTGLIFGPPRGSVYALSGALLSATVTYWAGRSLGRHTVRRLAGARLNRITRRLAGKGMLAVALIRLLPIAPFSIVNAVAGASYIRLRDFLLGTAIGVAPMIALAVTFVDRVRAALVHPGLATYAELAAVSALVAVAALFVWRRFGVKDPRSLSE